MFIRNTHELEKLISNLARELQPWSIKISLQVLNKLFAQSQGYETTEQFTAALPFVVNTDPESDDYLFKLISEHKSAKKSDFSQWSLTLSDIYQSYPIVAPNGYRNFLRTFWSSESTEVIFTHESNRNSKSWSEAYNRSGTFRLPSVIEHNEYLEFITAIKPLISQVNAGFTDNGPELDAELTEEALAATEEIQQVCEQFNDSAMFHYDGYVESSFEDLILLEEKVESGKLSSVSTEYGFLLDHSFSDRDIRELAGSFISDVNPVNENDLVEYFCNLRDMCLSNLEHL